MNTPSHLVLNLAVLGGGRPRRMLWPVAIGALLPDAPMYVFYAYQRLWHRVPEMQIWRELYFLPEWQAVFDLFNSIPLILLGLVAGLSLRRSGWTLLFASMLLHTLCDLPVHTEDAHRHFLPLSDFRFVSPVSYWDPRAYGTAAAFVELLVVLAASVALARRTTSRVARGALIAWCAIFGAGYVIFYWLAPFEAP